MNDITDAELAAKFGCSKEYVQAKCRAQEWPYYRIARTYHFTPEDVDAIKALSRPAPRQAEPAEGWGQKTKAAS